MNYDIEVYDTETDAIKKVPMSEDQVEAVDYIQDVCSKPNWDSYGATPITEATCELARKMLPHIRQVCGDDFSVSPSPMECISFEGTMPSGDEFNIEVYMERVGPTGSPRL